MQKKFYLKILYFKFGHIFGKYYQKLLIKNIFNVILNMGIKL